MIKQANCLLLLNATWLALCLACNSVALANDIENKHDTAAANVGEVAVNEVNSNDDITIKQNDKLALTKLNSSLAAITFGRINDSQNRYAEVVAGYCKQAKTGNVDALFALGWMYENGRGVAADKNIAAQLYHQAAQLGHSSAQQSLARFTDVQPATNPPTCLLPEPPPPVAITIPAELATANEKKAISDKTAALFTSQRQILKLVNKLAPQYQIDSNLAMAFIAVESNFNVKATSSKNAQGLMQLIPETAERFGVKDAYKAEDNIRGGLAYLRWLLAYYKGNVELVAAAYNAGEGVVNRHKGVPPYPETRQYVKKIASLYNNTTHPYQDKFVKASRIDFSKKKAM